MTHNIPIGNWSSYVKSEINGKESAPFIVGKSGGGTTDPAYGCKKMFTSTYQCGSGQAKVVNLDAEAWAKTGLFNCVDESKLCSGFRLTLGDDGNMTVTNNSGSKLWSSNTNKTGIALPQYSAKNGKFGRNYLLAGEVINTGEFIGSPSGNCYLIMSNGTGLQLQYNMSSCDETTGQSNDVNAHATYSIPKVNMSNVGKIGYVSNDGKLHDYPDSLVGQGTDYTLFGNYNSTGNDIKKLNSVTVDQCKKSCNDLNDCYGFVYKSGKKSSGGGGVQYIKVHFKEGHAECIQLSQLAVFSNGVNVALNKSVSATPSFGKSGPAEKAVDGQLISQEYPNLYHSNCYANDYWLLDLQQEYPVEKIVYYNRNNAQFASRTKGLLIDIMDSEKKVLKTLTLTGDLVQTFDIEALPPSARQQAAGADTCWLKNSDMFPKGLRQAENDLELYTRSKIVKNNNSCNKTIESTSAANWELFPIGEKMTMSTLCSLGAITEQERRELEAKHATLSGVAGLLGDKLKGLTNEKRKLDSSMQTNVNKLQTDIGSYSDVWEKSDHHEANADNIDGMLTDTDLNMISQNYKHILWTILALLFIMGGIKMTRF